MQQNNESISKYTYANDTGDATITVYHLFPGVDVAYMSVHMSDFDFSFFDSSNRNHTLTIHYCKDGRIEQELHQEFFYLMPGDCSFTVHHSSHNTYRLPLRHYHGISISIDLDQTRNPLVAYAESCGCAPADALQHICGGMSHIVLRSSPAAKEFFDGLYQSELDQRLEFLRAKMPELFFRMKHARTDRSYYDRNLVPRSQVETAKAVSDYISRNINEKIAMKHLCAEFSLSDTYLRNAFRNVYGMPVISFIRAQKMQCAAQLLIHTNSTIDEIAEKFGYENESKFSAAFKRIMGDPPGVYRKEHSKIQIL